MTAATANLTSVLRQYDLLEPEQLVELERELSPRFPDSRHLARELIQRGWLTPYQVNQVFLNHAGELILGQHILLERLGEGGMGAVFKARHRRLGRIDALKVIRKDRLQNPDMVRRFLREVQAVARLAHPNIVSVYDAGEVNGTHFLVMQYVEGRDLARVVKEGGPLPITQACEYVRQAAVGLQHAHEMGLVHRDIKPHNLLLTRDPPRGTLSLVKVLDMGLARVEQQPTDESGTLTRPGLVMGTVDYLAPEQARNSHRVDIRVDLYSLGCTLFFLLTGRVPFPGGATVEKLLRHQCEQPPDLEQLWPDIPTALADVVRQLLAKKPEDRYQTPAELTFALEPFSSIDDTLRPQEPLPSSTEGTPDEETRGLSRSEDTPAPNVAAPGPPRRRRRRNGRRAWAVLAAVAVGLGLLLGGGFLFWKPEKPTNPPGGDPGPRPAPVVVPTPAVFSLDGLDPKRIPADECFAWHPKELVALLGTHRWRHHGHIHYLTLSPDETLLASSSHLDGISLWDAKTGRLLARPQGGNQLALAFAPDSKTLAYGIPGAVVLWDVASQKKVSLPLPGVTPSYLAFSPDGETLAAGSWSDGLVRVWDLTTLEQAPPLKHTHPIRVLAFSPDGKTLAAGAVAPDWNLSGAWVPVEVVLWDVEQQTRKATLAGHKGFTSLAYSPDGKLLATAGHTDKMVLVWDTTINTRVAALPQTTTTWGVTFAPDSNTLAINHDSVTRLWDVARGVKKSPDLLAPGRSNSLGFADGGKTLFTGSYETGMIHTWDLATGKEKEAAEQPYALEHLALSTDGRLLAVGGPDRRIHLWDLAALTADPREKQGAAGPRPGSPTRFSFTGAVKDLAFAPDGKTLAVRAESKTELLATPTGQKKMTFDALGGLALSPDGKTLAVFTDKEIVRWPLGGGLRLFSLPMKLPYGIPHRRLFFAPDSRSLVAAAGNHSSEKGGSVQQFDLLSGEARPLGDFVLLNIASLAQATDGKTLAWWADDHLWLSDVPSATERHVLPMAQVRATAFSPDSRLLAIVAPNTAPGDHGQTLLLIDPNRGVVEQRLSLAAELGPAMACAFAADGKHLLVAYRTGVVLILRRPEGTTPGQPPPKPLQPILRWRLLGPLAWPAASPAPLPFDVTARDGVLEEADFLQKYPGYHGKEVGWQEVTATHSGAVMLDTLFTPLEQAAVFGHAVLSSDEERDTRLLLGSDDTLTVWLNGKQVYDSAKARAWHAAEATVPVRLRKGDNHLLVRCMNVSKTWMFSVHLPPRD